MEVNMQVGAYLHLRVLGENIDMENISNTLNVRPCNTYKKGDIFKSKYNEMVCQEDCWSINYEIPEKQSLDEAIISFTQPFHLNKYYMMELTKTYNVKLWISLYPEEYQMNLDISNKIISILHDLNIELSITTIYLSDFYEGKA